jgi:hypothetical protein
LDNSAPNLVDAKNGKDATRFLQNAIKEAEKFKVENAAFAGLILCCEDRMPDSIVNDVLKLTGDDAVARYQSLLPTINCTIDLVARQGDRFAIVLPVLPNRVKSISLSADPDMGANLPTIEDTSEVIV